MWIKIQKPLSQHWPSFTCYTCMTGGGTTEMPYTTSTL